MIILKLFGIIILFFVIFGLVTIFSLVFRFWGFFRQLTGKTDSQQQYYNQQNQRYGQQGQQDQWYRGDDFSSSSRSSSSGETISGQPKPRNSTVDKNEGEYVDFEELS